jgi:predicted DsbA family dithiol-disulfide isomerase
MVERLRLTARELDLPFGPRTKTYNSRLAQELGLWAEDQGRGESFHMAAFRAYFVDGLNLAKHSVLLELAQHAGLQVSDAEKILTGRTYAARVDKDWDDSRFMGITAVPTFVMGRHKLTGAQSYENLSQLVTLYEAVPK